MPDEKRFEKILLKYFLQMSLLEIITIIHFPESRNNRCKKIQGVYYATAYAKKLEDLPKNPFKDPSLWNTDPYCKFKILREKPPGIFQQDPDTKKLEFIEQSPANNWDDFLKKSFAQVRHNLFHGAKFFKKDAYNHLNLEDRDKELINAALSFIEFLVDSSIIPETLSLG